MQTQDHNINILPSSPPPMLSSFSESESDDDDNQEQQQRFDRISDILSTLIQEANEAVNNENPSLKTIPLVRKHSSSSSQEAQVPQRKKKTANYWHSSGSPRPVSYPSPISNSNSTRRSITPNNLKRLSNPALSNNGSFNSQDSPIVMVEASVSHSRLPSGSKKRSKTPSLIKRRPSSSVVIPEPLVTEPSVSRVSQLKKSKTPISHKRRSYPITNQEVMSIQPSSSPLCRAVSAGGVPSVMRRSTSSAQRALTISTSRRGGTDPALLLESFKRLDSSMAEIDSLSRDLATHSILGTFDDPSSMVEPLTPPPTPPCPKQKSFKVIDSDKFIIPSSSNKYRPLTFDARLSTLLLLPLLHIPHALISIVFDSLATASDNNSALSSFSSMVLWVVVFAVTNLVVDKEMVANTTRKTLEWFDSSKRAKIPVTTPSPSLCLQHDSAICMHSHQPFEKTHRRIKRRNSF
ncbi:hypothetical protein K501DRAFT_283943 [Backusella circina FSU 941]|nr:hypothetical protein K501DRAFT_283943 [Backusella circina FSU 941]